MDFGALPWQLSVGELQEVLAEFDPDAVVALTLSLKDRQWIVEPPADTSEISLVLNLRVVRRSPGPVFTFGVVGPPQDSNGPVTED